MPIDGNRLTFPEYLKSIGVSEYTLDHGALSPNGKVSKRAAKAWADYQTCKRNAYNLAKWTYQENINTGYWVDPSGQFVPGPAAPSPTELEITRLLRQAAELEGLADRGMSTRKYRKHAAELRTRAAQLGGA